MPSVKPGGYTRGDHTVRLTGGSNRYPEYTVFRMSDGQRVDVCHLWSAACALVDRLNVGPAHVPPEPTEPPPVLGMRDDGDPF